MVINIIFPPRVKASSKLFNVFSNVNWLVAIPITGTFCSINAIGPCFNSPAAYASEWMYEISFSFNDPSSATA